MVVAGGEVEHGDAPLCQQHYGASVVFIVHHFNG